MRFSSVKHRVGPDNYWLNQMSFTDVMAIHLISKDMSFISTIIVMQKK